MSDTVAERPPAARYFCHRCNMFIEIEDIVQEFVCPYCSSGFVEQLEAEAENTAPSRDDVSDADMSNLDDSDETPQKNDNQELMNVHVVVVESAGHALLSDLAFLMSGGQLRGTGRPESLLEQFVWTISPPVAGAEGGGHAAGTPFVVVGAPGDYVFGGEGLDAVVTQLLGQLDNSGPPPLPRDQIAAIPKEEVTTEQAATNSTCSVCWEPFQKGEKVSRLQCEHMFHCGCIEPWLQLHATCPICRRSLITASDASAQTPQPANPLDPDQPPPLPPHPRTFRLPIEMRIGGEPTSIAIPIPRIALRRLPHGRGWEASPATSSSSTSSVAGRMWTSSPSADTTSTSASSLSSGATDRDCPQYNMDIDYD